MSLKIIFASFSFFFIKKKRETKEPSEKESLKLRLWSYVFHNYDRAVEELYLMCEAESSLEFCSEIIRRIEASHLEFQNVLLLNFKIIIKEAKEREKLVS